MSQHLDSEEMIKYLLEADKDGNLLQMILYAHLFIEHGITRKIAEKLARPEILDGKGKYGKWSFHQKLVEYVRLVNPSKDQEDQLSAFNRLRNRIAHSLEDEGACVWECLPWKGEQESKPDTRLYLLMTTIDLLEDLGVVNMDEYMSQ